MPGLILPMLLFPIQLQLPRPTMETQLVIHSSQEPSTIAEILEALRRAHFRPTHESKVWAGVDRARTADLFPRLN